MCTIAAFVLSLSAGDSRQVLSKYSVSAFGVRARRGNGSSGNSSFFHRTPVPSPPFSAITHLWSLIDHSRAGDNRALLGCLAILLTHFFVHLVLIAFVLL
jgi:hypothetical protein